MNDAQTFIPPLDAAGLPAPAWVFVVLLNATLMLHFLAMGYVFTASAMQVFFSALAREGSTAEWMLRRTERPLPIALSFTITLGVAPLLFVQVLYQPFFYPSNILIGYRWFGIVPALIGAFYLIYLLQGGRILGRRVARPWLVAGRLAIFAALVYVLVTLTTNALTMMRPDRWRAIEAGGALEEPVFAPRLAHNVLAALVIGAVWMIALGTRSARDGPQARDRQAGRLLARLGALAGVGGVILQMFAGIWLIVAERPDVRAMLFSPRPAAVVWMASLAFVMGLAAVCMAALAIERSRAVVWAGWTCLVLVLGGMFAAREAARQVRLAPWMRLEDWAVHPQTSGMVVFLVLLALGLVVLAMAWGWVRRGSAAPPPTHD